MNPAVAALIADYFEVPEVEADGLLIHLHINGWTVVPIQEKGIPDGKVVRSKGSHFWLEDAD
jgi:hypothetical protein